MCDEKVDVKLDELRQLIVAQDKTAAVNVAKVTGKLDAVAGKQVEVVQELKAIKKTVNGNGESGLVGRMGIIETWREGLVKLAWWAGGIVGTVIASVILYYLLRA